MQNRFKRILKPSKNSETRKNEMKQIGTHFIILEKRETR